MKIVCENLEKFGRNLLPRILTQVCRDVNHPDYGAFDRNWWHYKIRDFASIILQQGGYALSCASQLSENKAKEKYLLNLAKASCLFWSKRAKKYGAFEEYYPWEQGYPPVAFSSLAVAKMVGAGVVTAEEVYAGLSVAAKQLLMNFEDKATNQQVAGMAALCIIQKVAPNLVNAIELKAICDKTLSYQHEEGWYMEYGGPDLGYLSVTMDCLWDIFDATCDVRFKDSAAKALNFIDIFVAMPQCGAGMFNARNTDYIVPYGIARFLGDQEYDEKARRILNRLFCDLDNPDHFLYAVDDRYFCHYVGHSIFRAIVILRAVSMKDCQKTVEPVINHFFKGTGHLLNSDTISGCAVLVAGKKGGVVSLDFNGRRCIDYGWVFSSDGKDWVSHWWGDFWKINCVENGISVCGYMVPHRENVSTPVKHLVLRGLSLVLGRRIIGMLKDKLIFKKCKNKIIPFERHIRLLPDRVELIDKISIISREGLKRAPRSSKRHVASADSYHNEDFCLVDLGLKREESFSQNKGLLEIKTCYSCKE